MRKETVEAHIRSMVGTAERPYRFSSGASVASGLQAAWYTLSPKWQGLWRNHDHPSTQRPALPLPYKPEDSIKAMILLSDGDNNWLSARGALSASRLVRPENRQTELFYNTYGNLASNRLGISVPGVPSGGAAGGDGGGGGGGGAPVRTEAQLASDYRTVRPRADAALDDATRRTCEKIKEAGIKIWAVGLGVMELAHRRLMEDCVSTPDNEDRK
ncbi:MAG: hypothetical protein ICV73_24295, partial [Acetobacteraceae bacterium]|nr:hypothetical protein [Acetobacteraceae bacterium]